MELVQLLIERLRHVLDSTKWDYCVLWKLSEDGRFIEWVDCCCGGSRKTGVEEDQKQLVLFPFSCKDAIFKHPRTKSCDLLAQLPSSIPFNSEIHAQTMISNQARWLNFSDNSVVGISSENVGTRVLIPVPIGLVELFVAKQVYEDQSVIDLVTSQFNISIDMEHIDNVFDSSFLMDGRKAQILAPPPPVSPATMLESLKLSSSATTTPLNFIQQFNYTENKIENTDGMNNESYGMNGFDHQEIDAIQMQVMDEEMHNVNIMGGTKKRKGGNKNARINRSDSLSDYSDLNDEDDDPKPRRRNGKGPSKNLFAERNRRKKLNDRLYTLRALVPKISKLDRASILGDAINYVMELQRQVQDLQNELEENSDDDTNNRSTVITQQEFRHGNGPKSAQVILTNRSCVEGSNNVGINEMSSKQNQELESNKDHNGQSNKDHNGQQMEPQVDVDLIEGNEFLVKVFCEHKPGGFVKLMEAFTSLGLEVTNVNVTSFRSLVVNVIKVEKRDNEMVEADHVRESLLELARHQPRVWLEDISTGDGFENDCGVDGNNHRDIHQYHHHSHLHNHPHLQFRHHPYHIIHN